MAKITLEQLAKDLEQLKRRVEYLESQLLTKQDIIEIEEFLRKNRGELELLSFDEALKELGIDEVEGRAYKLTTSAFNGSSYFYSHV